MDTYRSYGRNNAGRGGCQRSFSQNCNQYGNTVSRCGNTMPDVGRSCGCPSNDCHTTENRYMRKPQKHDCFDDCGDDNKHMAHMPIAMGFVPMQAWGELYDPCKALKEGTAFPCLNLIFCGSRGKM